jgi:hypothetical protein
MVALLAQYGTKLNKPLIEPMVHDDATRLFIIVLIFLFSGLTLYKVLRGYSE